MGPTTVAGEIQNLDFYDFVMRMQNVGSHMETTAVALVVTFARECAIKCGKEAMKHSIHRSSQRTGTVFPNVHAIYAMKRLDCSSSFPLHTHSSCTGGPKLQNSHFMLISMQAKCLQKFNFFHLF